MFINEIIILPTFEEKLLIKHNVAPFEIEEVFENSPHIRYLEKGKVNNENLYIAMGTTFDGRYLSIFFIHKDNSNVIIISARNMTKKERKSYEKFKK